jgi:hypothetical protein
MINVRAIAGQLVQAVHPDERVEWFASDGADHERGFAKPKYLPGREIAAQIQSAAPDKLAHLADNLSSVQSTRKAWFPAGPDGHPTGIDRPLGKGGDLVRRADGTWWLVTELSEDFSKSGWVSAVLTLQAGAPDLGGQP